MAVRHAVQQGDCLYSIAAEYGWFPETLWEQPENAALKKRRGKGDVLCPGDVVVIPDRRQRVEKVRTGARHLFRRKGIPHQLKVRLVSMGKPLGNHPYAISVDGDGPVEGVTDAEGWIGRAIDPRARTAAVVVGDLDEYRIHLGHLDPVDKKCGLQERLANLGYYGGPVAGPEDDAPDPATAAALAEFQEANALDASGAADSPTKAKLVELNGA